MKWGYSILLREIVAATEVDYGDCKVFQITCPNCHEAIFKAGEYAADRQYFSHYAASRSDVRSCELRVASYTESQIKEINAIGHAQTLKAFFESFQTKILVWLLKPEWMDETRKRIARMLSRPSFLALARAMRKHYQDEGIKAKMLNVILEREDEAVSEFNIKQQKAFAKDTLEHIFAPNSLPVWNFVFAIVIYFLSMTEENHNRGHFYFNLVNLDEKRFRKTFQGEINIPATYNIDANVISVLGMLLLCIPYVDADHPDISHFYRECFYSLINQLGKIGFDKGIPQMAYGPTS